MLQLVSRRIKTSQDVYFKKIFPEFSFESVLSGEYQASFQNVVDNYKSLTTEERIFEKPSNESDFVKMTILSNYPIDKKKGLLPRKNPYSDNETIIFYSGGGGFLANLQMIQENFLKKWAKNTGIPLFEMHYSLGPVKKYPTQTHEVLNMYMQVILYYKLKMKVKNLKVILMGDSAGGCIALSLMNLLAKVNATLPIKVLMAYPPTDLRKSRFTPSHLHSFEDGLLYFTVALSCFNAYVPSDVDASKDWLLSPGLAPRDVLAKYPETHFFLGEKDSLRDDALRMAYNIDQATTDSKVSFVEAKGLYHGFLGFQLPLGIGVNEVDHLHNLMQESILSPVKPKKSTSIKNINVHLDENHLSHSGEEVSTHDEFGTTREDSVRGDL